MALDYEKQYTDGDGGITFQWKQSMSKARIYLKLGRNATITLHEGGENRELLAQSSGSESVQRLRKLFGIID